MPEIRVPPLSALAVVAATETDAEAAAEREADVSADVCAAATRVDSAADVVTAVPKIIKPDIEPIARYLGNTHTS